MDARELARWLRIVSSNRLVNPDPVTWSNTGRGGYCWSADFCTDAEVLAGRCEVLTLPAARSGACPLFVELCAGLASVSLVLQGGRHARPPVSRMGNKRGYAEAILWACGLRQGQGARRFLWCEPDPGCSALLRAYGQPEVLREAAAIIRGWADEDPRELWERLKAEGPIRSGEAGEVARWAQVQSANELIPLGGDLKNTGEGGSTCANPMHGFHTTADKLHRRISDRILDFPAITVANDARQIDPREVARWARITTANRLIPTVFSGTRWANAARDTGPKGGMAHGGADFCTLIESLASGFDTGPTFPAITVAPDAREIDPPALPAGSVVFIDPPYVGTTGYGHDLPREAVVEMARRWKDAGALVCISEQEALPELMAEGWHALDITSTRKGQKRTFSKQQTEMLTMSEAPRWRPAVQVGLFG